MRNMKFTVVFFVVILVVVFTTPILSADSVSNTINRTNIIDGEKYDLTALSEDQETVLTDKSDPTEFDLEIKIIVRGNPDNTNDYEVHVVCTDGTDELLLIEGLDSVTLPGVIVPGIQKGSDCTVTETNAQGADTIVFVVSSTVVSISDTYTFSVNINRLLTIVNTFYEDPVDPEPTPDPVDPEPTPDPVNPEPTPEPVDPEPTLDPVEIEAKKLNETGYSNYVFYIIALVAALSVAKRNIKQV